MSLDVYSHFMPPDELQSERFLASIEPRKLPRCGHGVVSPPHRGPNPASPHEALYLFV